jgi:hypothetical protein
MGWLDSIFSQLIISAGGTGQGLFVYNGAVAEGNLFGAIVGVATVAPAGESVPQGFNFGDWSSAGQLLQHFGININGSIFLADSNGIVRFIGQSNGGGGTPGAGALLEYGATGPNPGTLIAAMCGVADSDSNGNSFAASLSGHLTAFHPASGGTTAETWQVVGTATPFENSFSAGGTAPRYRLEGIAGGVVRLSGAVNTGAVNAADTPMFNLPAGYRPLRQFNFAGQQNNITAWTAGSAAVTVNTNGDVWCTPASTAGKFLALDGITFELD